MPAVLLISYYFPPHHSVGGRRAYRFARHLADFGWDPVVLCAGPEGTEARDEAMLADLDGRAAVHADWHRPWARRARAFLAPEGEERGRLAGRLRKGLGDLFRDVSEPLPMGGRSLSTGMAAEAATRVGREHEVAAVWGTGPPFSALEVARRTARALERPLLLDLRDPWTFSPEAKRRNRVSRRWDRAAEARLLQAADQVVLTSRAQQGEYAKRHPGVAAERLHTIYTGFDGFPAPPRPARPWTQGAEPWTVAHFGNLYGLRTAVPLLEALGELQKNRELPPGAVRLVNYGYLPPSDREAAERLGVTLEQPGRVPMAEGLARLREADVLFLPTFGDQEWFIPGKLYDYLVAGRPVLTVCRGEELADIVRQTCIGCVIDPEDGAGLVRALGDALEGRGWAGGAFSPDLEAITGLSARAAARQLAGLLEEVTT